MRAAVASGHAVVVGEYSHAGPSFGAANAQAWATWLGTQYACVANGSFFWNYDAPIAEWSFSSMAVDWPKVRRGAAGRFLFLLRLAT